MNNEYILTTYYVFYEDGKTKGMVKVKAKDEHQARLRFAQKMGNYRSIKKIDKAE